MFDTDYWGGTDMVFQCLIDKKRTLIFEKAIQAIVSPEDIVVDLGSGSGILAMCALKAGAKKVYAVEADRDLIKSLKMTIKKNKLEERFILLEEDATKVVLPEKVNVVLCEMIATGLLDELQVPVINNIQKYCLDDCKFTPSIFRNFIDLVSTDTNFYGYDICAFQYEYGYCDESCRKDPVPITDSKMYLELDFTKPIDTLLIEEKIVFVANTDGLINGIRFHNESVLAPNILAKGTPAYCMPLIVPTEDIEVNAGQKIKVQISYKLCEGLHNLKYEIKKLEE